LSDDKSNPGANVAVTKVATLSKYPFEAPHKGSDLGPFLTVGSTTDSLAALAPVASSPLITPVSMSSRPDSTTYDAEQKQIKTEIDILQKLVRCVLFLSLLNVVIPNNIQASVKEKISNLALERGKRQTTLRDRLEDLQSQHSSNETSRNEVIYQIEALQDGIQKKVGTAVQTPLFTFTPSTFLRKKAFGLPEKTQNLERLRMLTHISSTSTPLLSLTCP
jgi:hypothetical protein